MVALACGDAMFTSRMVGNVSQTVVTEGIRTQAFRTLSRSRCPPLFNFFIINPWSPAGGHPRVGNYGQAVLLPGGLLGERPRCIGPQGIHREPLRVCPKGLQEL